MREVISIATVFLMLAAAGVKADAEKAPKFCRTGAVAAFLSLTC